MRRRWLVPAKPDGVRMSLCMKCRDVQKTCCQDDPRIILTQGDVRRIRTFTGHSDFVIVKHYPDLSFLKLYEYDPNWKKYTVLPGNLRRQLRMDEQGACVFLSAGGCELPMNVRPLMCRLYPYNFNEYGIIGVYSGEDMVCPVRLLKEGVSLDQAVGMSYEQADSWRMAFYQELRAEWRLTARLREETGGACAVINSETDSSA